MAIEATLEEMEVECNKEQNKNDNNNKGLDDDLEFSWGRVLRRGVQNMKDDVDPVYKGAKIGVYALHGIPTWVREFKDGKLSTDSVGWSAAAAIFVGGASVAGYILAAPLFPPILALPVAAQGASYIRESFRRARKTELENIVLTKVQRSLSGQNLEKEKYDLTCEEMIEELGERFYKGREDHVNREIESQKYSIQQCESELEVVESATDLNSVQKHKQKQNLEQQLEHTRKSIDDLNEKLDNYKTESREEARQGLVYLAKDVFNGLFADNGVGSDYEMGSLKLEVGPKKRKREYIRELHFRYSPDVDEANIIAKLIKETVAENGGTANIELFGKMTSIYSTKQDEETHYNVAPNELWKRK